MRASDHSELPLLEGRSALLRTLAGIAAYLVLDYVSFLESYRGLAITPWSPGAGLALALVLLAGWRAAGVVLLAPAIAGALVRGPSLPTEVHLLEGITLGSSYLLTGLLVRRFGKLDLRLAGVRDVLTLMSSALFAATASALGYVGVLGLLGLVKPDQLAEGIARFVVGDLIGMLIVTPTILLAATRRLHQRINWETAAQMAMILLALAAIFGLPHASEYQLFYLLFLPLLWSAFRNGVAGAALALCVIQVGLILTVNAPFTPTANLMSYQILMIWLAATGLVFGGLVVQQQTAAVRLHYQQLALGRALRLRSMGEVASGIAHEVSQPLTSIKALTGVLGREIAKPAPESAQSTLEKIRKECDRASQIIRATREAVRQQVMRTGPIAVARLLAELEELVADRLAALDVRLVKSVAGDAAHIVGDPVQLTQALYNLLDNSLQAIEETGRAGTITVAVRCGSETEIEFEVQDTGPGFLPELLELGLPPLVSTRNNGTGIGLSIARSVAEAHGGSLSVAPRGEKTCVKLTIARLERKQHAEYRPDR